MNDFWRALLETIERLFGKLGAAALLASAAFFVLPARWLSAIGLNTNDHTQRFIAGLALLGSTAACIVSLGIRMAPSVQYSIERIGDRRHFKSIPLECRVLLGMAAQFASTTFYAPASLQAVQILIDLGYFEANSVQSDLKVFIRVDGNSLISENRTELRQTAAENPEIVRGLALEILEANQRAQERNRLGWMLG